MQTVIMCGGTGTRLKEMSEFVPKPLIQIGGVPMAVHIMRWYAKYGFKDFVLALGYKQEQFKQYFAHFYQINNDIKVSTGRYYGMHHSLDVSGDDWQVTLSDTGENTLKGGRLKRVEKYIHGDTFMLSYGDGLSDINFRSLVEFHRSKGKIITVVGVHPPGRFGEIHRDGTKVLSFTEKPEIQANGPLINAGFYVCNRKVFNYLTMDECCDLERGMMEFIANEGEMAVYHHNGFWKCCDTLNDLIILQKIWDSGDIPWIVK